MIYNTKTGTLPLQDHYNHCIIGSGPAGLSLAITLAAAGRRVVLVEAGDREFTSESQIQYEGEVLGLDTHALDVARLRYLGGTTGHWTGRLLQFDPADFEPHDNVPLSGWPINHDDLSRYHDRAARFLGAPPFGRTRRPADDTGAVDIVTQHFSSADTIFDLRKDEPRRLGTYFANELERSTSIDTLLNANFTGFAVDTATGRITSATIQDYADNRYSISADSFVTAMGGIETSRALLHLNATYNDMFGNQGDMVGRCFMDHPRLDLGSYFITKRMFSPLPYFGAERLIHRAPQQMVLSPSPGHARQNHILNAGVWLNFPRRAPLSQDTIETAPFLRNLTFDKDYFFSGEAVLFSEQSPNPRSRITLTYQYDRFGLAKAALDWQLLPLDVATMRGTALAAAQFLIRNGLGRMQVEPNLWNSAPAEDIPFFSSSHHIGGARMGPDPSTSVVDENCRVHGAQNLFVSGAAVFPTSGFANPTYTLVQLAMRLADHLIAQPT